MGYNFGVGREAPLFTLTAHDGSLITLTQYRGDWFPVLVFLPADPAVAGEAVTRLSAAGEEFWGYRGQLVGIVAGDEAAAKAVADAATKVAFPLVGDADGAVARAYGAWNAADETVRNCAVVVDRSGKIVWNADGGATAIKPATIVAGLRTVAR